MLSYFVLLLSLAVGIGTVATALREMTRTRLETEELIRGIDAHTREEGEAVSEGADTGDIADDLDELLTEAFQNETPALSVLAVNEITGRAEVAIARARAHSRSLSRMALLAGGAGAFGTAALGGFQREAMFAAGTSVVGGALSSFVARFATSRSIGSAKRYADLSRALAKQIEAGRAENDA